MKNLTWKLTAVAVAVAATPALAQDEPLTAIEPMTEVVRTQVVLNNPCKRGPLPRMRFINKPNMETVEFLQMRHPEMPLHIASNIARDLCDDTSVYGDSAALTARLNYLMGSYGY